MLQPVHTLPQKALSLIAVAALAPTLLASSYLSEAQDPPSEESITYFKQNCASCHTIGGGRLTGPDLKGVTDRKDKSWLIKFIKDPKAVIDGGDPYAQQILSEARGVYMPPVPGMTNELAGKLVDLIATESVLEKSQFAGIEISDRPLTEADVVKGEALFMGRTAFINGAPACVSCHTVTGVGGLGGGLLGPDLTSAYARLEGRNSLSAWLAAPPSAVMQPVFVGHDLDSEEILALVAFMKDRAAAGESEAPSPTLTFVIAGLALASAFLVFFDLAWRTRFRSVRRSLIANN